MKRQFNKILFSVIVIVSVIIGFAVWNLAEKIQGYAVHIAIGFFAVSTIVYSLILGHLDKTKPLQDNEKKEDEQK